MRFNLSKKDANFSFNIDYLSSEASESVCGKLIDQENMATKRRSARTVAQRRKMKLHNRKDDIPECLSLEEISFDGKNIDLTTNSEHNESTSDTKKSSKEKCMSSEKIVHPHGSQPTTPLVSTNNEDETVVSMSKDIQRSPELNSEQFKSCSSINNSLSTKETGTTNVSSGTGTGTSTSRTGKKRRKKKRSKKPSLAVKFVSHLFENIGLAVTEFCMFAMKNFRNNDYTIIHKPTAGILILVAIYFIIMYLEISFAGFFHMLMEFLWPALHVVLRMFERFFSAIAGFFSNLDDVGESSYCDMAQLWCDYFHLMCENRCSFTKFALDRLRR